MSKISHNDCSRHRDVIYRACYRVVCLEHMLSCARYILTAADYMMDMAEDSAKKIWIKEALKEIERAIEIADFVKKELMDQDLPGVEEGKIKFGEMF